jgi:hypothetical protein
VDAAVTGPSRGLDALAAQIDDLRRDVEGIRHTVDADVDALASLLDESLAEDGRPAGALPALSAAIADVRAHVTGLADQIADLVDDPGTAPRLPTWSEMDADTARAAWRRLASWMGSVLFPRYPPSTEVVRDCWYRHPELVEHLSWLHVAWALAYHNPNASISTAAEWHTRWLPAVLVRAREILKPCYIDHVDDSRVPPERHRAFDRRFDHFVDSDVSRRPRTEGKV